MRLVFSAFILGTLVLLLCLPGLRCAIGRRNILCGALLVFCNVVAAWAPLDKWNSQVLALLVSGVAIVLLVWLVGWKRVEFALRAGFNPGTGRDVVRYLLPLMLVELVVLCIGTGRTAGAGIPLISTDNAWADRRACLSRGAIGAARSGFYGPGVGAGGGAGGAPWPAR